MADMTLDALMRQALAGQQQKRQSLSDRMAEIDKYAAQVAPNKKQQYGDAMSMNAPLANPLTLISNQLSDGDVASSTRRAYEADMDINQNELYKIMAMLQDQSQFDQEYKLKAADSGYKLDSIGNILPGQGKMSDADAISQLEAKHGISLKGGTIAERGQKARDILANPDNFRVSSLLPKEESEKYDKAENEIMSLETLQQKFQPGTKNTLMGQGNLTGTTATTLKTLFGWDRRSQEQVSAQSQIARYSADKINELSGAAVSPEEAARLEMFLPSGKTEEGANATQIDGLLRWYKMQNEVREIAARRGMTIGDAYRQNKAALYQKYGFNADGTDGKTSGNQINATTNTNNDPLGIR